MAFDKVIDSAQLDGALEATANEIRKKTGETGSIPWDADNGFASAIGSLEVGGGEEYDKYDGPYTVNPTTSSVTLPTNNKVMLQDVTVNKVETEFQEVTPEKNDAIMVAPSDGKFLSGVRVEKIPDKYADTSDATATATDMVLDQTAYVDGQKIIGTMKHATSVSVSNATAALSNTNLRLSKTYKPTSNVYLSSAKNTTVQMTVPLTNLGNATAEDVAIGKFFTSSAGVNVEGRAEIGGGGGGGNISYFNYSSGNSSVECNTFAAITIQGTYLQSFGSGITSNYTRNIYVDLVNGRIDDNASTVPYEDDFGSRFSGSYYLSGLGDANGSVELRYSSGELSFNIFDSSRFSITRMQGFCI